MSLVPRCDRCGGLEVINGPMGRSMESRCKCNEQRLPDDSEREGGIK
jgi:hypothetical protein